MDAELEARLDKIEALTMLAAKDVYSVKDLSILLGKNERTIYNIAREIPHYRNGHGIWFKREDVKAWQCQVKCTPVSQLINN